MTQFSETEDGRYLVSPFPACLALPDHTARPAGLQPVPALRRQLGRDSTGIWGGPRRTETLDRPVVSGSCWSGFFSSRSLSTDWEALKEAEDELLINSLAMLLEFDPEDKQALLEAPCLATRRETLVTLIEFALRGGSQEETLQ